MKHCYPITHTCNHTHSHTQLTVWMCIFLVPESFQVGGVSERFNNRRSIGSCHKIILRSSKHIYSYLLPSPVSLLCIEICINSASLQRAFPFFVKSPFIFISPFICGSNSNASDHEFIRQKYTVSPELSGMKALSTRKCIFISAESALLPDRHANWFLKLTSLVSTLVLEIHERLLITDRIGVCTKSLSGMHLC